MTGRLLLKKPLKKALIFVILVMCLQVSARADLNERLLEALKQEIKTREPVYSAARIEIIIKNADRALKEFEGTKKPVSFSVDFPPNRRMAGKLVVPVNVLSGGRYLKRINLLGYIGVFMPVLSASKKITKGDIFSDENAVFIEKDISNYPVTLVLDKKTMFGKEATTLIPQGTVLLEWMAKQVPLIRRGDIVDLVKNADNINIKTKAVALEEGYGGKIIKVKNSDSNKVILAKVKGVSEVEAQ